MTLSPKYGDLYQWFIFADKPLENGSMIAGLKKDAPESIKKLYKEYLLSKEE